jgi:predicted nucleic acid-binding protein
MDTFVELSPAFGGKLADLLIGAFACRRRGLITRNPANFKRFYPGLKVLGP